MVTPTYDEIGNLEAHVGGVLALGPDYRLVIVDDASPDGTGRLADRLARANPGRIEVIHRDGKLGLGSAYVAGIAAALHGDAAVVATMDADGSHRPTDLAALVGALAGSDVVLGSRYAAGGSTSGWSPRRRLLSRLGGRYAGAVLGLPLADPTSGFRVMRRAAAEVIPLDRIRASGYAVNLELTWRAARSGCRIAEVPIAFRDRTAGASKLSAAIVAEAALLVWALRFGRGRVPTDAGIAGKNRMGGGEPPR